MLEPTKKDILHPMTWQEGLNCNKIKSHICCIGNSETGKQLFHRSSPTGVKVLSSTQAPQLDGLAMGEGARTECGFEDQWDLTSGIPQDWKKQKLYSWKAHTGSCAHQDPVKKAVTS